MSQLHPGCLQSNGMTDLPWRSQHESTVNIGRRAVYHELPIATIYAPALLAARLVTSDGQSGKYDDAALSKYQLVTRTVAMILFGIRYKFRDKAVSQ